MDGTENWKAQAELEVSNSTLVQVMRRMALDALNGVQAQPELAQEADYFFSVAERLKQEQLAKKGVELGLYRAVLVGYSSVTGTYISVLKGDDWEEFWTENQTTQ